MKLVNKTFTDFNSLKNANYNCKEMSGVLVNKGRIFIRNGFLKIVVVWQSKHCRKDCRKLVCQKNSKNYEKLVYCILQGMENWHPENYRAQETCLLQESLQIYVYDNNRIDPTPNLAYKTNIT